MKNKKIYLIINLSSIIILLLIPLSFINFTQQLITDQMLLIIIEINLFIQVIIFFLNIFFFITFNWFFRILFILQNIAILGFYTIFALGFGLSFKNDHF